MLPAASPPLRPVPADSSRVGGEMRPGPARVARRRSVRAPCATRIGELRNPPPRFDDSPDERLTTTLRRARRGRDLQSSFSPGLEVARCRLLLGAIDEYVSLANPLADFPTVHLLRRLRGEQADVLEWTRAARAGLAETPPARTRANGPLAFGVLESPDATSTSTSEAARPVRHDGVNAAPRPALQGRVQHLGEDRAATTQDTLAAGR